LAVDSGDLTALPIEVARFVGDLLKEHAGQIWADEDWRVDVTDEKSLILYVMHISAVQAPAVVKALSSAPRRLMARRRTLQKRAAL
jgi:hypothetical protein